MMELLYIPIQVQGPEPALHLSLFLGVTPGPSVGVEMRRVGRGVSEPPGPPET